MFLSTTMFPRKCVDYETYSCDKQCDATNLTYLLRYLLNFQ